jgi:deoxycytidine triphosphate deaminase
MAESQHISARLKDPVPVLSNTLILELMAIGRISIKPFDPVQLGPTSYRIRPDLIRFHFEGDDERNSYHRSIALQESDARELRSGEHVIVSPSEKIQLAKGFIADFFPSSWCIERKLIVTAGRLDAGYEAELVFGVFNAGRVDVTLTRETQLLRASFGWLGSQNIPEYPDLPPGSYIPDLADLRGPTSAAEDRKL